MITRALKVSLIVGTLLNLINSAMRCCIDGCRITLGKSRSPTSCRFW